MKTKPTLKELRAWVDAFNISHKKAFGKINPLANALLAYAQASEKRGEVMGTGLKNVVKHQETVMRDSQAKFSATWNIAKKALADAEGE